MVWAVALYGSATVVYVWSAQNTRKIPERRIQRGKLWINNHLEPQQPKRRYTERQSNLTKTVSYDTWGLHHGSPFPPILLLFVGCLLGQSFQFCLDRSPPCHFGPSQTKKVWGIHLLWSTPRIDLYSVRPCVMLARPIRRCWRPCVIRNKRCLVYFNTTILTFQCSNVQKEAKVVSQIYYHSPPAPHGPMTWSRGLYFVLVQFSCFCHFEVVFAIVTFACSHY